MNFYFISYNFILFTNLFLCDKIIVVKTRYLKFTESDLHTAGELIRAGELVGFPTETVYGLGADALNESAVRKTYVAKGRPSDNPLIVHIFDKSQIYDVASDVSPLAQIVIERVMPAPITVVLPKKPVIKGIVTAGLPSVAIRMPQSDEARRFLRAAATPVSAPSANISGRPSPTTWQRVKEDMDGKIAAVLCGEPCKVGIESTVLDLSRDEPVVLRPGAISAEFLSELLGVEVKVLTDPSSKVNSPGVRYKHYAPNVPMVLELDGDADKLCAFYDARLAEGYKPVLWVQRPMLFGGRRAVGMGANDMEAAANLFETMRMLEARYNYIIASFCWRGGTSFDGPASRGVLDRLMRACGHNII